MAPRSTLDRVIGWFGVALVCGAAVLAAMIELFLVPLYSGAVLVPLAALLSVASNVVLPRMGRALVPTTAAAVLPFAAWLIVVVGVGLVARPEGDVVLPGGGAVEWVGLGTVFAGIVAGIVTVVLSTPRPQPTVQQAQRPQPVNG